MSNMNVYRPKAGKVWLVGAGPGDPDLLTIKALKAIEQADLILFDQLVGDGIKDLFPASTPSIYVGKVKGHHSLSQSEINELLVSMAAEGLNVARLKGGDPFVFGRGGEEMLELAHAGIEVDIVPGITAAAGCAASTQIPLTHRGLSQGCTFVTGHAEKSLDVDWTSLANLNHTLVFYMGLTKANDIETKLLAAGMEADTPVAVIENGSRENQREVIGHLDELTQLIENNRLSTPALIIVGKVVNVADQVKTNLWADVLAAAPQCA